MLDYVTVTYKKNKYCVCHFVKQDGSHKLFVIDKGDLHKVLETGHAWFNINGYVGYSEMIKKVSYYYYLHNLIMDKPQGGGKGQKYTIDHISRNKYDNRKVNLRLTNQSSQNENQKRRERTSVLPDKCGIKLDDIPKCVYYCGPQSGHGEMFVAELKKNGDRTTFKSCSSKKIPLKDKLTQIKKILYDVAKTYPELMEDKSILENYSDEQINLMKEYNEIIKLSEYDFIDSVLLKIPKKEILKFDIDSVGPEMKNYFKIIKNGAIKTGRQHMSKLPLKCGITPDMIPKYCYYKPKTDKRGDAFVIDRHPKLPEGKRQWSTTSSKKKSTMEKFKDLKKEITRLESHKTKNYGSKTGVSNTNKAKTGVSNTKTKTFGSKTSATNNNKTTKKTNNNDSKISASKILPQ